VSSLLVWSFIAVALGWLSRCHGDAGAAGWPQPAQVGEILRIGLPIGIATLADVGLFLGATLYAGTLSTPEAAAHALAIRTAGVTYTLSIGLMQASTVRVARRAEHGNAALCRESIATALVLAAVTGVLLGAGLAAGALAMLSGTAGEGGGLRDTIARAAPLIALLAGMELFGTSGANAAGVLRGLRDTRTAMVFALLGNWGVAAPVGLGLSLWAGHGVTGIWIGLAAGTVTGSLLTLWRVRHHWHDRLLDPR
jgi:MATE family multidrug resistance protein